MGISSLPIFNIDACNPASIVYVVPIVKFIPSLPSTQSMQLVPPVKFVIKTSSIYNSFVLML